MTQWNPIELKGYTKDGDPIVEGYGVVFGGEDLYGETFTKDTDFWFAEITKEPPVLYQHGFDEAVALDLVGKATVSKVDEVGVWFEAQLAKANKYKDDILKLVKAGKLGWSTGSVPHLVRKTAGGEIKSWPVVELSLTPEPAEPRTFAQMKSAPDALKTMSYEEIRMAIDGALLKDVRAEGDGGSFEYVHATYADHAIVCRNASGTTTYYKVPYTIDDDKTVSLGERTEVEPAFVPVTKALSPNQVMHNTTVYLGAVCRFAPPAEAPAAEPDTEPTPDAESDEAKAVREAKAAIDAHLATIVLPRR